MASPLDSVAASPLDDSSIAAQSRKFLAPNRLSSWPSKIQAAPHYLVLKFLSTRILHLVGWQLDHRIPTEDHAVVIGFPHTSNWDFIISMLAMPALGFRFNWVAKHSMFFWPLAGLFKRMGGIPLDRDKSIGFVEQTIAQMKIRDRFVLVIAPEGTRSRRDYWKSGFYHVAVGAGVPISLGYIDYGRKVVGVGKTFKPSGDIDADFAVIAEFYADKHGLHPAKQSPVTWRRPQDHITPNQEKID
ncbi:lysophospholipid acyltransferase family protein [Gammaproteobacteria bacterium]|nr:lysophospholipid acyltransferase family protein [Gammaproteobacteria bacterium]